MRESAEVIPLEEQPTPMAYSLGDERSVPKSVEGTFIPKPYKPTLGGEYKSTLFNPTSGIEPEEGVAAGVAEMLSYAALGLGREPVTPTTVYAEMTNQIGSSDVSLFLTDIQEETEAMQKQLIMEAVGNSNLDVVGRLQLSQAYHELAAGRKGDTNAVERVALETLIEVEFGTSAMDEDDKEWQQEALVSVHEMPTYVEPVQPELEEVELQEVWQFVLNSAYEESTAGAEGSFNPLNWTGDFAAAYMLPARLNVHIMQVYDALGLTQSEDAVVTGTNAVLVGNALKTIRDHVQRQDYKGKLDSLATILEVLRPNSGIFKDGNAWINLHVLEEVFFEDLYGTSYEEAMVMNKLVQDRWQDQLDRAKAAGNTERVAQIEAAMQEKRDNPIQSGFTQILDNMGGILDATIVGGVAVKTLRAGSRSLSRTFRGRAAQAPRVTAEQVRDALAGIDPSVAERLGMSLPELAESVLPAARVLMNHGGVNGAAEDIARNLILRQDLLEVARRSTLSTQERAAAAEEIVAALKSAHNARPAALHLNRTSFTDVGDGVHIKGVFGRDEHHPYTSFRKAQEAADDIFGAGNYKIVRDTPEGLVDASAGRGRGRFYIEADEVRPYDAAQRTINSLVMDGDDVTAVVSGTGFDRWVRQNLRNIDSIFSKDAAAALSTAKREEAFFVNTAQRFLTGIAELPKADQMLLSKVIKKGERVNTATGRGQVFTPSELAQEGLSNNAIREYYNFRTAADVLYEVTNNAGRQALARQGMREIVSSNGRVGFGKVRDTAAGAIADITTQPGSRLAVFDAGSGTYVRMSASEIEALYAGGKQLARLKNGQMGKRAGEEATHVILDGKGVRTRALPAKVINHVEGYYPHMFRGNFIVSGTTPGGMRVALGTARTKADADAIIGRLRANPKMGNKFREINGEFDRSLSEIGQRGLLMDDLYVNMGGPIFGERTGGMLKNFSRWSGDNLVDPVEALLRGMELVGNTVTKKQLAEHMWQKATMFARQKGLAADNTRVVKSADDLVANPRFGQRTMPDGRVVDTKSSDLAKLQAYLGQVDVFLRAPNTVDQATSAFLKGVSGILDKVGLNKMSGAVLDRAARTTDPVGFLTTTGHKLIIASNPGGHFALQSLQSLMLLGIAPGSYAKAAAQFSAFNLLYQARNLQTAGKVGSVMSKKGWDRAYGIAAKAMGLKNGKEAEQLMDVFYRSGIVDAVAHHAFIRSNIRNAAMDRMVHKVQSPHVSTAKDAGRTAARAANLPIQIAGKVGFEAGEHINQIMTFLTMFNRDRGRGVAKLSDPEYTKKLIGEVSALTGNMVTEAGFKYQRGWLKAAFQFVSFQHKMVMLMLPESLGGGRTLSGWDKFGMAMGQFLLFGRRGAFHFDAFYRYMDKQVDKHEADNPESGIAAAWRSDEVRAVMDGLLFDKGVNMVMQALTEDDIPEFALSARFAPGGGSEFMADRLLAMASNPTTEIFGMGGAKLSQIYQWMDRSHSIILAQAKGLDNIPVEQRLEEIMKGGGNLFSQYGRFLTVSAARKMDGWINAGGQVHEAYYGGLEDQMFLLFGVNTKERENFYALRARYEQRMVDPAFAEKELDDLANEYMKQLIFASTRAAEEATSDEVYDNLLSRWALEQNLVFSMLERHHAERVSTLVEDKVRQLVRERGRTSAERAFVERMVDRVQNLRDGPAALKRLEHSEIIQANPALKQLILNAYEEATTLPEDNE